MTIDPYAFGIINSNEAHKAKEIINVYIYESQQQIISVAEDRTVVLLDAFRLEKLQMIKDVAATHIPKFTSSQFDQETGNLYVGDQKIQIWKALVDSEVEINALQVLQMSKQLAKDRNVG